MTVEPIPSHYRVFLTTCPDVSVAKNLASLLLEKKLVACVNIVPHILSLYEWQGKMAEDNEVLMIIKTRQDRYTAIEQVFTAHHPYEVPELIVLPIETGLSAYLQWIDEVTN